eukprot:m.206370 g.206370  ORF g.206370 m.206370 type:complete len:260 (-) comp15022_c0_seq1:450-1229(-)
MAYRHGEMGMGAMHDMPGTEYPQMQPHHHHHHHQQHQQQHHHPHAHQHHASHIPPHIILDPVHTQISAPLDSELNDGQFLTELKTHLSTLQGSLNAIFQLLNQQAMLTTSSTTCMTPSSPALSSAEKVPKHLRKPFRKIVDVCIAEKAVNLEEVPKGTKIQAHQPIADAVDYAVEKARSSPNQEFEGISAASLKKTAYEILKHKLHYKRLPDSKRAEKNAAAAVAVVRRRMAAKKTDNYDPPPPPLPPSGGLYHAHHLL